MKKRINLFISTYFYFNKQERKGVITLLFLLVLFQLANYAFPIIYLSQIRSEPNPEMVLWALAEEEDLYKETFNYSEAKSYPSRKPFLEKNNFNHWKSDSSLFPKKNKPKYPIELNLADSETLVQLPKIGPVLAGRMVQYRNKLRGFHTMNQLMEVWGFKEDFLYDLEGKITLNPTLVRPYLLNVVNYDELKLHPYFKFTLSKALVNYRMQHGNYHSIEGIKQVKLVNDSIFNLISPYLKID